MKTESPRGQQTWPLSKSGASYKCIPHFDRWKPQLQSRRRVFPSVTTSRVIRRGDGIGILGKKLFNYRYKERLERNSVVGRLVEKRGWITWFTWNTNHHLRRPQASFHSPEGEETLRPPPSDLRSPGKISRLGEYARSRWEFSQKGKERMTRGNQSFQKLIHFLHFQVWLYTFCYT